ncbi:uncharacterized protein LOC143192817 isoform X2 [Rhynchophorus ferrugineus]|uniref:uncharacterized protein LOC143192817 isoform X2 n=1 Tax=Rhynchophorus ferrugineus TaxID=354439 RepID=UPI003FCE6613
MTLNDSCLYAASHRIPFYHKNGFIEERQLSTILSDNGERIQIKLRDLSDCCFNFTENISIREFEKIRVNQTLDINYGEFKTNIIEMLHQFQTGEIYLKGELQDKKCLLTFYTKSKIKNIIFLMLELHLTDQSEIITEMYLEMSEVQNTNKRLQKQLCMSKKQVQEKELEVEKLEITKNIIMSQFCRCFQQVDELFSTKINYIQNLVLNKMCIFKTQIMNLQKHVESIKKDNDSKAIKNKQILVKLQDLQQKVNNNEDIIYNLKKENSSLIMLRVNLERSIADLNRTIEDLRNINNKMEVKNNELENDLKKFSIIVTQKEDKISELSKDLVQANNMLVGFNQQYDKKSQKVLNFYISTKIICYNY